MEPFTRRILAHRRLVVGLWVVLTIAGIATAGAATSAMKQKFSVPGREGWEANQAIAHHYGGTGGNEAPLVPVVALPPGRSASEPAVTRQLAQVEQRLERALPGSRVAGYGSTRDPAFVSKDGRTAFAVAYPPPDPDQPVRRQPQGGEEGARGAARRDGRPARPSTSRATTRSPRRAAAGNGPGVLVEALLGGLGALVVLGFVFGSLLALRPAAHGDPGDHDVVPGRPRR